MKIPQRRILTAAPSAVIVSTSTGYSEVGIAPALGAGDRAFESHYSDQNPSEIVDFRGGFLLCLLRGRRRGFSFSYLWFLTFLYHDYGYCVVERDDAPIAIPTRASIPNNNYSRKLQVQVAFNIEYTRGSHKLTFSSSNNAVDISELHRRAKGLEEWTCAHCTETTGGAFTLFLGSGKTVGGSR